MSTKTELRYPTGTHGFLPRTVQVHSVSDHPEKESVYGIFFDNTYRSYVNLGKENQAYFYYGADAGNLDYYFIAGDTMPDIVGGYTYLTGRTPLPQLWTLVIISPAGDMIPQTALKSSREIQRT